MENIEKHLLDLKEILIKSAGYGLLVSIITTLPISLFCFTFEEVRNESIRWFMSIMGIFWGITFIATTISIIGLSIFYFGKHIVYWKND